jgi:predicted nucleic acid-binding protein
MGEQRAQRVPIYTTDYVLDEVITLLFRREVFSEATRFAEVLFAGASLGSLIVERITSRRFVAAWELRKRLQDKPRISFTDLTSIVVMQELGISRVLTEDEHFLHVGMGFSKVP